MAGLFENKQTLTRIFIGIFVGLIAVSMLLYLVPQGPGAGASSTDTVATVAGQDISLQDIRERLAQLEQARRLPKQFESIYAPQILDQIVFEKEIQYEANNLGISVTNEEMAQIIKQILPGAFNGDNPVGAEQYATLVLQRFQMPVSQFEGDLKKELLVEKFRKLVTDGISASPAELKDQFVYQNQKVKLEYALIKPDDLEAKVNPDETELKAYYEKNKTKYMEPERRSVRYALIDVNKMRVAAQVSDKELNDLYQSQKDLYLVLERVRVEHILLFTQGKNTEAEIAEVQKRAEDVLKELKKGAKFEDLAKKYSEDTQTKDKGGLLPDWIQRKQTVPSFEKAAFETPVGQISNVVRTEYGFHIIKVLEKEPEHMIPFEQKKPELLVNAKAQKGDKEANALADKVSAEIRKSNKVSLDDLAKQFGLDIAETMPVSATDPVLYFGNAPSAKEEIFRLQQGQVSMPVQTDRGYVVLSLKDIVRSHPGTFDEERGKLLADVKREKAAELAKSKADELLKRVKAGEKFESAAKALGLEGKTSELISRTDSIPAVGSGKQQLSAAFQLKAGEVGAPQSVGPNWLVYRVAEKAEANPQDFEKQKKDLTSRVLQEKRDLAFQAFRTALDARLKKEGKLKLMPEKLKGFGTVG